MSEMWSCLKHCVDQETLAHAYVIESNPEGEGRELVLQLATYLLTGEEDLESDGAQRIESGLHPDILWVEPRSKSRQILVDDVNDAMRRMNQHAYEGGYKLVVISHADRLNQDSSNKLLKTLEEPPGKALILLLTDAPHLLLATIRSRCQRILMRGAERLPGGEWKESVFELLRQGSPGNVLALLTQAAGYKELLDNIKSEIVDRTADLKDEIDDDKVIDARVTSEHRKSIAGIMGLIQAWYRDIYLLQNDVEAEYLRFPEEEQVLREQAERISSSDCFNQLREVERMARRIERNLPAHEVFEAGLGLTRR